MPFEVERRVGAPREDGARFDGDGGLPSITIVRATVLPLGKVLVALLRRLFGGAGGGMRSPHSTQNAAPSSPWAPQRGHLEGASAMGRDATEEESTRDAPPPNRWPVDRTAPR